MTEKKLFSTKTFITLSIILFIFSIIAFEISTSSTTFAIFKKKKEEKKYDVYEMLEVFGKAFEITKERYVEEVDNKKLIEGAIDGMLTKLDPHSSFLNTEEFTEMMEQTSGAFGGLGIEVTMDSGVIKVISPIDDSPAYKAGIKAGDMITHIDDVQVYGLTLNEAVKKMKGKAGTKVKLKIFRKNKEPFNVEITRDIIKTDPIKFKLKGKNKDVGYLRLATFNENSFQILKDIVQKTLSKNPKILGFVLDLRNNTGGLLDEAVKISDAFLEQGEIVSVIGRQKSDNRVFFATGGDIINGKPLVVIINGASASASEIVAGALQDHKRAVIIGTKSYGKGSVQTLIPMGATSALKLTTAKYYTPSGRSIQADGIEPDVVVNVAKLEEFKEDRIFSESTLTNALKNDTKNTIENNKNDIKKEIEKQQEERDDKDYQLNRAIDFVRAISVYNTASSLKDKEKDSKKDIKSTIKDTKKKK